MNSNHIKRAEQYIKKAELILTNREYEPKQAIRSIYKSHTDFILSTIDNLNSRYDQNKEWIENISRNLVKTEKGIIDPKLIDAENAIKKIKSLENASIETKNLLDSVPIGSKESKIYLSTLQRQIKLLKKDEEILKSAEDALSDSADKTKKILSQLESIWKSIQRLGNLPMKLSLKPFWNGLLRTLLKAGYFIITLSLAIIIDRNIVFLDRLFEILEPTNYHYLSLIVIFVFGVLISDPFFHKIESQLIWKLYARDLLLYKQNLQDVYNIEQEFESIEVLISKLDKN